jgi:thymidylate synthase
MQIYHEHLKDILDNGVVEHDRTGVGTIAVFGRMLKFDLSNGFPIVTTKKIHFKSVLIETLWFLTGSTNIKMLQNNNVTIWDEWADENGDLGPVYGHQWRNWPSQDGTIVDQIAQLEKDLRSNPASRRHIVTAWNPAMISQMRLPPCHMFWQLCVTDETVSVCMYIRSNDTFLGLPFNIVNYALLTHMFAHTLKKRPGELTIMIGNAHIYSNHMEQVKLQLTREPRPLPALAIKQRGQSSVLDFAADDFDLLNYHPHPGIKAPVAV